jgi:hypothetical protein
MPLAGAKPRRTVRLRARAASRAAPLRVGLDAHARSGAAAAGKRPVTGWYYPATALPGGLRPAGPGRGAVGPCRAHWHAGAAPGRVRRLVQRGL